MWKLNMWIIKFELPPLYSDVCVTNVGWNCFVSTSPACSEYQQPGEAAGKTINTIQFQTDGITFSWMLPEPSWLLSSVCFCTHTSIIIDWMLMLDGKGLMGRLFYFSCSLLIPFMTEVEPCPLPYSCPFWWHHHCGPCFYTRSPGLNLHYGSPLPFALRQVNIHIKMKVVVGK